MSAFGPIAARKLAQQRELDLNPPRKLRPDSNRAANIALGGVAGGMLAGEALVLMGKPIEGLFAVAGSVLASLSYMYFEQICAENDGRIIQTKKWSGAYFPRWTSK